MQTNSNELTSIPLGLILLFTTTLVIVVLVMFIMHLSLRKRQTKSFKNILVSQEKERERIAKDMHDHVGPLLSKLKLSFDAMNEDNIKNEWGEFKLSCYKIIDSTIQNIRETSFDLMPRVLYHRGLIHGIEDFCEMMSRGLTSKIFFSSNDYPITINKQSELNIYRIIQEIIHNALKHSLAKNIYVSINGQNDMLMIFVNEDGIGFDFEKMKKENINSLGLKNIESRVSLLGGKLKFKSRPNYITSYLITFKNNSLI